MSARRGKQQKLSHTGHRQKKDAHDGRTNRKGKLWAKKHIKTDKPIDLDALRAKLEARKMERRQIERLINQAIAEQMIEQAEQAEK